MLKTRSFYLKHQGFSKNEKEHIQRYIYTVTMYECTGTKRDVIFLQHLDFQSIPGVPVVC